jgi:toxin YhaV
MLDAGHPQSDWSRLLAKARAESERLARLASGGAA